jgi:hypothetical protein
VTVAGNSTKKAKRSAICAELSSLPLELAKASAVLGSVVVTDGPWQTLGH